MSWLANGPTVERTSRGFWVGGALALGVVLAMLVPLLAKTPLAQAQTVPRYQLQAGDAIPLGGMPFEPTMNDSKCDAEDNVYLRFTAPGYNPHFFSTPVTEFSADGEKVATYSLSGMQGWSDGDILGFAIGRDSTVYLLADHMGKGRQVIHGVLAFDQLGAHLFTIPLDLPFFRYDHIAAFSTGELLVTGSERAEAPAARIPGTPLPSKRDNSDAQPVQPLGFVVGQDGRVISKVVLSAGPPTAKGKTSGPPIKVPDWLMGLSSLVSGEDGNVYALFPTPGEPTIYVISSSGEVVRELHVKMPPTGNAVMRMGWADGLGLLLQTGMLKNNGISGSSILFSVVDPETGDRLGDYSVGPGLGAGLGCFTRQHIYFLGSDTGKFRGKLVLREAEIR